MSVYSVNQKVLEANGTVTGASTSATAKSNAAIAAEFLSLLSRNSVQINSTVTVNNTLANHVGNTTTDTVPQVKPAEKPANKPAKNPPVTADSAPRNSSPEALPTPERPAKNPPAAESAAPVKPSVTTDRDNGRKNKDPATLDPVTEDHVTAASVPAPQPPVQFAPAVDTAVEVRPAENPQQAGDEAPTTSAPQTREAKPTLPTTNTPVGEPVTEPADAAGDGTETVQNAPPSGDTCGRQK